VKVTIPSPLEEYTRKRVVAATGATLDAVLRDLDRQYPGIRFRMIDEQDRIRAHIKIFVNKDQTSTINQVVASSDEILIVAAISGG
jgi:sulfur-carrier protein